MGSGKRSDPSKVLHFRNIPESVHEIQVIGLCEPFGQVTQVVYNKLKRRALVEFQSVRMAMQCCGFFERVPCVVGGNEVTVTFSSRKDITNGNPINRVLQLNITNIKYPVSVEILTQIFKPFVVRKIAYQEENVKDGIGALVELDDMDSAVGAFYKLQNKNIYANCNTVRVKYSALKEVDGTDTDVSIIEKPEPIALVGRRIPLTHPVCILHGCHPLRTKPEEIANVFQAFGEVVRVKIMYNSRHICLVQMGCVEDCHRAINNLNGFVLHGCRINVEPSKGLPIPMPPMDSDGLHERLTVDFTQNYWGRAFTGPQRCDGCALPSNVLRVVEPHAADEILKTLQGAGMKVTGFNFPNIEFGNVHDASFALATCHAMALSTGRLLLTFA